MWDQTGLFHVNQVWSNKLFDSVFPWLRESAFWLPLYLFFFAFALLNFGKRGAIWVIFFLITVTICDQLSGYIKHWIQRPRPCNDPLMMQFIRLRLSGCAGGFSFTSSHAANHFGLAMFINLTLRNVTGIKTGWLFLWAFFVCYAQMYVGVHYPLDILGGMLVGLFGGGVSASLFNLKFRLSYPGAKVLMD